MTNEQKILNALSEHSELTKSELKEICDIKIDFDLNLALSKLVYEVKIKRIKQGVYALDKSNFIDQKQTSLF